MRPHKASPWGLMGPLKCVWPWCWGFPKLNYFYLVAAAWQSWHPCRHPPSASSPALWSVFPLRSLQPPSYFSRLETPVLKSQVSGRKKKKMKVGLFGGRLLSDRWPHLCSWSINCPQPTLDNVWVFSNLRRGFWASSAHLTEENQWSARTGVFRAELKMRGDADIHHCRSGLTFGGLCCLSGRWTSAQVLIALRCSEAPLKETHAKQHGVFKRTVQLGTQVIEVVWDVWCFHRGL